MKTARVVVTLNTVAVISETSEARVRTPRAVKYRVLIINNETNVCSIYSYFQAASTKKYAIS